jgi:hypothetical protein
MAPLLTHAASCLISLPSFLRSFLPSLLIPSSLGDRCESLDERDSWVKVLQEESLRFKPLHEIFLRRREEINPIEVTPIVVPQAPLAEGWMRERWNIPKISWKRRYMVLYSDFDGEGDTIFYYVSQQVCDPPPPSFVTLFSWLLA